MDGYSLPWKLFFISERERERKESPEQSNKSGIFNTSCCRWIKTFSVNSKSISNSSRFVACKKACASNSCFQVLLFVQRNEWLAHIFWLRCFRFNFICCFCIGSFFLPSSAKEICFGPFQCLVINMCHCPIGYDSGKEIWTLKCEAVTTLNKSNSGSWLHTFHRHYVCRQNLLILPQSVGYVLG